MPTKTPRERFEEKYKDYNFHHKGLPCFCDHILKNSIIEFWETLLEEARQEERNKIKEKLLKGVEEYKIPKEIKANKLGADYIFVYDLKTFVISSL